MNQANRTTHVLACSVLTAVSGIALSLTGCASAPRDDGISTTGALSDIEARRAEARAAFSTAEQARTAGNTEQAIEAYEQAVALDSTLAEAWNNLGVLRLEQGTYLEAADAFRRALATAAPEDPRPARNLGYTYAQAGWAEEALKHYETALDRSPNDLGALRGAVRVTRELNIASPTALDRVRNALLVDRDEAWRRVYFSEESRIREAMQAEERAARRR